MRMMRPSSAGRLAVPFAGVLALAVVLIGPSRELAVVDDWAYAQTVETMLRTGQYQPHDWLAANSPAHIGWGALWGGIAGLSFTTLRFSTIAVSAVGLIFTYLLAREHRVARPTAVVLTFAQAVALPYLFFSLSFMTDVPYVAAMTAALLFFTRALRTNHGADWLAAGVAAALATLTRQFGVIVLPALAILWVTDPRRWQRLPRYLLGAIPPAIAGVWQVRAGLNHPTWAAQATSAAEAAYLADPAGLWVEVAWRPVVAACCLAVFVPAAIVPLLANRVRAWRTGQRLPAVGPVALGMVAILAAGAAWFGHRPVMPFEVNGSVLAFITWYGPIAMIVFTLGAVAGGVLLAVGVRDRWLIHRPTRPQMILDLSAGFAMLAAIAYHQFQERYLLVLLPYVVVVAGRATRPRDLPVMTAVAVLTLAGSTAWVWSTLATTEPHWTMAERLRQAGVPPDQIGIRCWVSGWGWRGSVSFADYAQITDPRSPRAVEEFAAWGGQVLPTAEYHIVADWEEDGSYTDWVPVDRAVEFFPLWFRWFTVTTYRRPAREPEWPAS